MRVVAFSPEFVTFRRPNVYCTSMCFKTHSSTKVKHPASGFSKKSRNYFNMRMPSFSCSCHVQSSNDRRFGVRLEPGRRAGRPGGHGQDGDHQGFGQGVGQAVPWLKPDTWRSLIFRLKKRFGFGHFCLFSRLCVKCVCAQGQITPKFWRMVQWWVPQC